MTEVMAFDEAAALRLEATYLTPDVVAQRCTQLRILEPRPGEHVLDVGCGPGLFVADIAQSVGGNGRVMVDPDVPRFRRKSNQNIGGGGSSYGQGPNLYDHTSPGVSPNIGVPSGWGQSDNFGRGGLNTGLSAFGGNNDSNSNQFNIPPMSPNALAGLQSPSGGLANPLNMQVMNMMAAMGGLNLRNMNGAQLLAM